MKFDEVIRMKALQLKAVAAGITMTETFEQLMDSPEAIEEFKMRQVCAMVTPQLFQELEGTCQLLGMSKRKFVEAALIDAMEKAATIVSEVDPFTSQEAH